MQTLYFHKMCYFSRCAHFPFTVTTLPDYLLIAIIRYQGNLPQVILTTENSYFSCA